MLLGVTLRYDFREAPANQNIPRKFQPKVLEFLGFNFRGPREILNTTQGCA